MSETRQKSHAVLLRTEGKTISVELFPAAEWPEENGQPDQYRVRINDVWHCPTGKYSFLTWSAVGELVTALLRGDAQADEPAPYLPYKAEVSVYLDDASHCRGVVHAPPHQERDGRWYVWVWVPGGPRKPAASDVTLLRVRGV